MENFCLAHALDIRFHFLLRRHYMLCLTQCSYKNVLAIWGYSRWKLTLTEIVSLRPFSFVLTAIFNSQEGCRCTIVPRLLFPVPRSLFPVRGISNIRTETLLVETKNFQKRTKLK